MKRLKAGSITLGMLTLQTDTGLALLHTPRNYYVFIFVYTDCVGLIPFNQPLAIACYVFSMRVKAN